MLNHLKRIIYLLILVLTINTNGQTRIKSMFYNILNYDSDTASQNRTADLKDILDEVSPDLFMVCELINETASDYLFNNAVLPHNNQFEKAPFEVANSGSLQQMVYYNKQKLTLEGTIAYNSDPRDINRYTFRINTENADTDPIKIEVFVTHLKASRGDSNRQRREAAIGDFITVLNSLPTDSYILFAGDFNFYTSNEEGYASLIDANNSIVMVDPIDRPCPEFPNNGVDYFDPNNYNSTYFWNNSSFADVHTQSTRTSGGNGAGGGMDDRFDFIMMSENLSTSSDLYYVDNTYEAIGNNGNCYNSFVSSTSCSGAYSQNLRDDLLNFSDHLPVVMDLETPQNILSIDSFTQNINFSGSNLVTDELVLTFNSFSDVKKLIIYNQLGQVVKEFSAINSGINNKKLRLDVNNLSNGLYYLKSTNQQKPLKFIKY